MEFKEYTNPEKRDYDINSSFVIYSNDDNKRNVYSDMLTDLIGIQEDITEEELIERYGITLDEYIYPTKEVINKVQAKLHDIQR